MYWLLWRVRDALRWLERRAGLIGEVGSKHRSALLVWSGIAVFVDHDTKITFGSASLAGLGITVDPPQTLPVGLLVFFVVAYRLLALWFTAFSAAGTDSRRALLIAQYEYDPDALAPLRPDESPAGQAEEAAEGMVYRWSVWQMVWELVFPTFAAVGALVWHVS